MSTEFDDDLRRGLHAQVDGLVDPNRLRPLQRSSPGPRRRPAPILLAVAAAVVTIAVVVTTAVLVRPGVRGQPLAPDQPVVVEPTRIRVDGLVIAVPEGLNARSIVTDPVTQGHEFCLLPQNNPAMVGELTDCLGAGGLRLRVAATPTPGAAITPLPGGFVDRRCPDITTPLFMDVPELTSTTGRGEHTISVHCGEVDLEGEIGPADSVYWTLLDQSLDLQTPYTGTLQEQAQQVLDVLDLSTWNHAEGQQMIFSTEASPATS